MSENKKTKINYGRLLKKLESPKDRISFLQVCFFNNNLLNEMIFSRKTTFCQHPSLVHHATLMLVNFRIRVGMATAISSVLSVTRKRLLDTTQY